MKNKDELIQVYLTKGQLNVLQSLIREREELELDDNIDSLVEKAKEYRKIATEIYPKDKVEIWVDEDEKRINCRFPDYDNFWNNLKIAELIIQFHNKKKATNDKPNRRIYV